jgi:putative flavoprotein involved in K+ transport
VERYETLVVGAGQAGLAIGHHLAARGVDFALITDEARVGDNWRRRWDSLRLFTPAAHSGLPGMPFPAAPSHLPDKDDVADYLERYAERFDLPVRTSTRVESLRRDGDRFVLTAHGVALEADNVVVATGAFQRPKLPALAAALDARIVQLHSSEYQHPFALPDGPVLVVGAGNSGAQIALELVRHRPVWLAGRDTGCLPRRLFGRDVFDWVWPFMRRASVDTGLGRRLRARARCGGDARIGIPERALIEAGIRRTGRLEEVRDGLPVVGAEMIAPAAVVWCTGFTPDYSWIDLPVFGADGYPRHVRGEVTDAPGLFFLGLRFQHRMSSSLIGGVGDDAAFLAARIARRCDAALAGDPEVPLPV